MPDSNQPFAAAEVLSKHDITQHPNSANDDLPVLDADEITDLDLQFIDDDAPPGSFEPPEATEPVAPMALARVSFNEQATLSFDGYQETFQVTLLNLSTQGVACLGPHGLNVADAVRLTFSLNPNAEPVRVLCEVMWSQPSTSREDAYGLRFTALDQLTATLVEDVVRQRCKIGIADPIDGFDSAVMAAVSSRPPTKPSMAPWVVAACGAALGMLATLAAMVVLESDWSAGLAGMSAGPGTLRAVSAPAAGAAQAAPVDARVAAKAFAPGAQNAGAAVQGAPGVEAAGAATVVRSGAVVADAKKADGKADGKSAIAKMADGKAATETKAKSASESAGKASDSKAADSKAVSVSRTEQDTKAAAASAEAKAALDAMTGASRKSAAPAGVATAEAGKAAASGASVRQVGDLRVEETDDSVALTLRTRGPAILHEEFWLRSPQRLVVDVPAARNGMRGRQFDVANPLVARVRVGDHADKVRFVIETGKNVSSRVRAKASGNALRIEFKRQS